MTIIAVDPGSTESAFVVWDGEKIILKGKERNEDMRSILHDWGINPHHICVIEMIASYGMAVGAEVFETCVWVGRFMEMFGEARCERIKRLEVKLWLCHDSKAKDANIRQALIDRLGVVGTKNAPGPLFGVAGDMWAALAVAVTWWDKNVSKDGTQKLASE